MVIRPPQIQDSRFEACDRVSSMYQDVSKMYQREKLKEGKITRETVCEWTMGIRFECIIT